MRGDETTCSYSPVAIKKVRCSRHGRTVFRVSAASRCTFGQLRDSHAVCVKQRNRLEARDGKHSKAHVMVCAGCAERGLEAVFFGPTRSNVIQPQEQHTDFWPEASCSVQQKKRTMTWACTRETGLQRHAISGGMYPKKCVRASFLSTENTYQGEGSPPFFHRPPCAPSNSERASVAHLYSLWSKAAPWPLLLLLPAG